MGVTPTKNWLTILLRATPIFVVVAVLKPAWANSARTSSGAIPIDMSNTGVTNATIRQIMSNTTQLLETVFSSYDRLCRPHLDRPLSVTLSLYVYSIGPISEKAMVYTIDCYFRQYWQDERLAFTATLEQLSLSAGIVNSIWRPDTYFWNSKYAMLHKITIPNRFLRIKRDGTISYSQRLTIMAGCSMYLRNYPLDVQRCKLTIGSFAYPAFDIQYGWIGVSRAPNIQISQFDVTSLVLHNTTVPRHLEEYSIAEVEFILTRRIGWFLINIYIPCALLVVISWVQFWINREAAADRISLSVMTVLTMTFIVFEMNEDLPDVDYRTALDIYVYGCYIFLIISALEFAVVHRYTKGPVFDEHDLEQLRRRLYERELKLESGKDDDDEDSTAVVGGDAIEMSELGSSTRHRVKTKPAKPTSTLPNRRGGTLSSQSHTSLGSLGSRRKSNTSVSSDSKPPLAYYLDEFFTAHSVSSLDSLSRFVLPLLFVAFNLTYFKYYLDVREEQKQQNLGVNRF